MFRKCAFWQWNPLLLYKNREMKVGEVEGFPFDVHKHHILAKADEKRGMDQRKEML